MARPPPKATELQSLRKSGPQDWRTIAISCRGVKAGLAGVAVVAGSVAGAGDVAVAAGADLPPPNAPIADWQAAERDELCCCRQVRAA